MRARGFTLIEAVVAVAVLALLTTLTLPSFSARLTQHRLKAAAEHLVQDISEARFQSAQTAQALYLVFAGSGPDWCYAVATSPGCDCRDDRACQLKTVRSRDLPGVGLESARDAHVDPMAPMASTAGADLVSRQGERLRVHVSPLGRPQTCAVTPLRGYPDC